MNTVFHQGQPVYQLTQIDRSCIELNNWNYDGEGLRVASLMGIGTCHEIFLNYENMSYTYLASPEGGPCDHLKMWAKKKRPCWTWQPVLEGGYDETDSNHKNQMVAMRAAILFATEAAFRQIEDEHSTPEDDEASLAEYYEKNPHMREGGVLDLSEKEGYAGSLEEKSDKRWITRPPKMKG